MVSGDSLRIWPQAIFLFVDEEPSQVEIYPDLDSARESLESLDAFGRKRSLPSGNWFV